MWTWRRGGGVEFRQDAAGRVVDLHADVGRDDRAAVGDRRVGDRHLQRVGLQVALAGGELDVVAGRPGPVGFAFLVELVAPVLRGQQPFCSRRAGRCPVGRPMPSACAQCCRSPVSHIRSAQGVEEDVRGHFQRRDEADRAVRRFAGVLEDLAADFELAGVVDHFARGQIAAFERRDRGDRLEGRAGRVEARDRAVGERRRGFRRGRVR